MTTRTLTRGQRSILAAAALLMLAVGVFGAWGTYSNTVTEFGRAATAAGVVAAGEGLTLILAMTMLGLTLLGQAAPAWVRVGLWLAPVIACLTGLALADDPTEAAVYAVTPLAMSGAAEGLGLIARRVVIYTTGVDAEAQRRNADAVQQLAYQSALAAGHPDDDVKEKATRKAWRLAKHVGVGDQVLGAQLVDVQRDRISGGANAALAEMYGGGRAPAALEEPADRPRPVSATERLREHFATLDPAEAIRLAADARRDAGPVELADILGAYGVPVDPVAVALVLAQQPPEYEVHRDDAATHQKVSALEPVTLEAAVVEAASLLGENARARQIVEHIASRRRLVVTEGYVRTALSRARRATADDQVGKGGQGYN